MRGIWTGRRIPAGRSTLASRRYRDDYFIGLEHRLNPPLGRYRYASSENQRNLLASEGKFFSRTRRCALTDPIRPNPYRESVPPHLTPLCTISRHRAHTAQVSEVQGEQLRIQVEARRERHRHDREPSTPRCSLPSPSRHVSRDTAILTPPYPIAPR